MTNKRTYQPGLLSPLEGPLFDVFDLSNLTFAINQFFQLQNLRCDPTCLNELLAGKRVRLHAALWWVFVRL